MTPKKGPELYLDKVNTPRHLRSGKRYGTGGRGSSTPGITKGEGTMRVPMSAFFAKRNRSYKHKGYAEWSAKHRG